MIKVTSDIKTKMNSLVSKLYDAFDPNNLEREMAINALPLVHMRVHEQGKASNGTQIGTYDSNYLELRKKHGYSGSKVVLSLTTQMQNDFVADVTTDNHWAIGWLNDINSDKAKWMEEKYGKKIFNLTKEEKEAVLRVASKTIENILRAKTK